MTEKKLQSVRQYNSWSIWILRSELWRGTRNKVNAWISVSWCSIIQAELSGVNAAPEQWERISRRFSELYVTTSDLQRQTALSANWAELDSKSKDYEIASILLVLSWFWQGTHRFMYNYLLRQHNKLSRNVPRRHFIRLRRTVHLEGQTQLQKHLAMTSYV